jgi:hypothetical protein
MVVQYTEQFLAAMGHIRELPLCAVSICITLALLRTWDVKTWLRSILKLIVVNLKPAHVPYRS